jgi:hypothetical protein
VAAVRRALTLSRSFFWMSGRLRCISRSLVHNFSSLLSLYRSSN